MIFLWVAQRVSLLERESSTVTELIHCLNSHMHVPLWLSPWRSEELRNCCCHPPLSQSAQSYILMYSFSLSLVSTTTAISCYIEHKDSNNVKVWIMILFFLSFLFMIIIFFLPTSGKSPSIIIIFFKVKSRRFFPAIALMCMIFDLI